MNKFRTLGNSGLRVSSVGLGCMGMSHAYGKPADKDDMIRLIADAVEMGYTFLTQQRFMALHKSPIIMNFCLVRPYNRIGIEWLYHQNLV